jgi:hypothetical protein
MKENGPRRGRAWGTRLGREVNVFSSINAAIYAGEIQLTTVDADGKQFTFEGFRLARSIETAPPID